MSFKSGLEKIVNGAKNFKNTLPVLGALALSASPALASKGQGTAFIGHSIDSNQFQAEGEVFFPIIQNAEGEYLDGFHIKGEVNHDVDSEETTAEYDAAWVHRFYDGIPSVWSELGVKSDVYGSEENDEHGYMGMTLRFPTGPFMVDVEGEVLLDDERVGGGIELGANYYTDILFADIDTGLFYTGDSENDVVSGAELQLGINSGELFDYKLLENFYITTEAKFEQGKSPEYFFGGSWYF
jgi:hypothetical protein